MKYEWLRELQLFLILPNPGNLSRIFFAISLFLVVSTQASWSQELMGSDHEESFENLYDLSLEQLMDIDIRTGRPGWFGTQLEQLGFEPYIHGYAAAIYRNHDANRNSDTS